MIHIFVSGLFHVQALAWLLSVDSCERIFNVAAVSVSSRELLREICYGQTEERPLDWTTQIPGPLQVRQSQNCHQVMHCFSLHWFCDKYVIILFIYRTNILYIYYSSVIHKFSILNQLPLRLHNSVTHQLQFGTVFLAIPWYYHDTVMKPSQ